MGSQRALVPDTDAPTISCTRCDRQWTLEYELDELQAGNSALEQFALDHRRHTGHFPDGIETYRADCKHCTEQSEYVRERPARRWAKTHARHTHHEIVLKHAEREDQTIVEPE